MGIHSKTAFAVLALALMCTPLLAQDGSADNPSAHQGARDGYGSRRGQLDWEKDKGGWDRRHGGFRREGQIGRASCRERVSPYV